MTDKSAGSQAALIEFLASARESGLYNGLARQKLDEALAAVRRNMELERELADCRAELAEAKHQVAAWNAKAIVESERADRLASHAEREGAEPFCWAVQNDQGYFVGAYTRKDSAEIVKNRGTHGETIVPLYSNPAPSAASGLVDEITDAQIREIAEREVNPAYDENTQIITYVTRVVRACLTLRSRPAQGDSRDARRYALLRRWFAKEPYLYIPGIHQATTSEEADAAIDAAMSQQEGK